MLSGGCRVIWIIYHEKCFLSWTCAAQILHKNLTITAGLDLPDYLGYDLSDECSVDVWKASIVQILRKHLITAGLDLPDDLDRDLFDLPDA